MIKNLIESVMRNDVKPVKDYLAQGVNPDSVEDGEGITALHYAVLYKAYEAAIVLLAHGANSHAQNSEGDTPLALAQQGADKKMLMIFSSVVQTPQSLQ